MNTIQTKIEDFLRELLLQKLQQKGLTISDVSYIGWASEGDPYHLHYLAKDTKDFTFISHEAGTKIINYINKKVVRPEEIFFKSKPTTYVDKLCIYRNKDGSFTKTIFKVKKCKEIILASSDESPRKWLNEHLQSIKKRFEDINANESFKKKFTNEFDELDSIIPEVEKLVNAMNQHS